MATDYIGVKKFVHVWGWHLPLDFTEIDMFGAKWSLAFGWVGGVLDIRIEAHACPWTWPHILHIRDIIGQHGQWIQIERQTTCFNEAEHFYLWLLLTVGNGHHISVSVIRCQPHPLDLIDLVHAFVKLTSTVLESQTFNMGCIWSPQNLACQGCNQARSYRSFNAVQKEAWGMVEGIPCEKCLNVVTILVLQYKTFETSLTPFPLRQFQKPAEYLVGILSST